MNKEEVRNELKIYETYSTTPFSVVFCKCYKTPPKIKWMCYEIEKNIKSIDKEHKP